MITVPPSVTLLIVVIVAMFAGYALGVRRLTDYLHMDKSERRAVWLHGCRWW